MRDFTALIRNIPDFPKPGIQFKDITTLLNDPAAFRDAIDALTEPFLSKGVETVAAIDARGFIIGSAVAYRMGCGFVPIRKRGKLPHRSVEEEYALEYGTDVLAIHEDAFVNGKRVLLVDDVIATGGTVTAATRLIEKVGGELVGIVFLVELSFLNGRKRLEGYEIFSLVQF